MRQVWQLRTCANGPSHMDLGAGRGGRAENLRLIRSPLIRLTLTALFILFSLVGWQGAARADEGSLFLPFLVRAVPKTSFPIPAAESYTVQPGDTLFSLARRFHRPLSLMACALPASVDASAPLQPGQRLLVPPERSVCHVVEEGQTLTVLARAYGVTVEDIAALPQNELRALPFVVRPGQRVLIPLPPGVDIPAWAFGDGHFRWPVKGIVSQGWSRHHTGLDIAAEQGTPVASADTGVVAWAGWDTTGYGWLVIVDHGNGYRTYYAHLESIWVAKGERVIRGQPLGTVGSTGNSTGPHVHFEIRDYGRVVDPVTLLPPR